MENVWCTVSACVWAWVVCLGACMVLYIDWLIDMTEFLNLINTIWKIVWSGIFGIVSNVIFFF